MLASLTLVGRASPVASEPVMGADVAAKTRDLPAAWEALGEDEMALLEVLADSADILGECVQSGTSLLTTGAPAYQGI
jgi:hypothetical protein